MIIEINSSEKLLSNLNMNENNETTLTEQYFNDFLRRRIRMQTGYTDPYEYLKNYSFKTDKRVFFKNGIFHFNSSDIFLDTIDLEECFRIYQVDNSLKKIWICGNEATLRSCLHEFKNA